jgi:60 kDa SS-A/Ro ribonucleoprotein
MPKRLISTWLNGRTDRELFNDAIGSDPSLVDVLKMVHPKPATKAREALFAYLLDSKKNGSDEMVANLPQIVKDFEAFKTSPPGRREIPSGVSFERLTAQNLSDEDWVNIAKTMSWTQLRMNLNTLERHGVFKNAEMVDFVASRLQDPTLVAKANVFPYQLFSAYRNVSETMPAKLKDALDIATSLAIKNVPNLKMDNVLIAVDCSGSMNSPISHNSSGVPSKITCNDVASLMACCLLSACGNVKIARFDGSAEEVTLSPQDSILSNAKKLNRHGGSTDCSAPLKLWNHKGYKADLVVYLSDNESWGQNSSSARHGTGMNQEWKKFLKNNPNAKLVCLDVTPNTTVQVNTDKNVLNVGGFSDSVFTAISSFLETNTNFVQVIENSVTL